MLLLRLAAVTSGTAAASVAGAIGTTTGIAITSTAFGAAGAGLTGYKMHRRTRGLTHFEFLDVPHASKPASTDGADKSRTSWFHFLKKETSNDSVTDTSREGVSKSPSHLQNLLLLYELSLAVGYSNPLRTLYIHGPLCATEGNLTGMKRLLL